MKSLNHAVSPEDVMAFADGELTAAEAANINQHIEACAECAALLAQMQKSSDALKAWTVPSAPLSLDQAISERLSAIKPVRNPLRDKGSFLFLSWRVWRMAGASVVCGVLALVGFSTYISYHGEHVTEHRNYEMSLLTMAEPAPPPSKTQAANGLSGTDTFTNGVPTEPLIARTVSLKILVDDVKTARPALEKILAEHHGYAAKLTIEVATEPHGLTSSLRVPVGEVEAAIAEMRNLGHVEVESQSGEEVTQQHADLSARLTNARETEVRLRDILANRTGKMQDVLDVEEKISETRGEIEQLEAAQKNLQSRIDFATVDLELVERYEDKLDGSSGSVPNQMHNSFIRGVRHAGESLLGLLLFFMEYGPVLLIWILVLGVPSFLFWRRYRRAKNTAGIR